MPEFKLSVDRRNLNALDVAMANHIQDIITVALRNRRPDELYLAAQLLDDIAREHPKRSQIRMAFMNDAETLSNLGPKIEGELISRISVSHGMARDVMAEFERFNELRICYLERKFRKDIEEAEGI